jgi:hypothetical protein
MSDLTVKRQWAYIRGMMARIEEHNAGLPVGQHGWKNEVQAPEVCNHNEDGEAAPFIVWEGWEQKKAVAKLCGRGPDVEGKYGRCYGDYPYFDDRVDEGFSDEYTICSECYDKLIRTSPDSYSWTPDFHVGDGYIMCADCMASDPETIIEDCKNENKAVPESIDPTDHGWTLVNDPSFESGWFPGQNDDPTKILGQLQAVGIDVLFKVSEQSQFYMRWDVYVPDEDVDQARIVLGIAEPSEPPSCPCCDHIH